MPNKIVDPQERKELLTIKIKRKNIDKLRSIKGYNLIIEKLIEEYFKKNNL